MNRNKTVQRKKWPKRVGIILLTMLILLSGVPYLVPLSAAMDAQTAPPFENSAFEQINGFSFHYRQYQPWHQPARGKLLLVHGLGGSTFSFETLAPLLAEQGYLVISVDLPAFGYSSRSLNYNHSQANRAADLWQMLSRLDATLPGGLSGQPWHLAGHSMGGGTVAAMALGNPVACNSLILIDPALSSRQQGRWLVQMPPLKRWLQIALEHWLFSQRSITRFLTTAYGQAPSEEQVAGYLTPLRLPGTAAALGQMLDTMENVDTAKLAVLNTPVLAIWGKADSMVPVSELEILQAIRPDLHSLVIEGAAHCPMETHPQAVAEAMLAWMNAHAS